jgi:protein-disulfide isomerase
LWRSKDPATYFSFERQRHEMTMHALQEMIAQTLLEREASRRGTTAENLIAAEVKARTTAVSEEGLKKEFERMKESFPYASFEEARPMVVSSLNQRQAAEARLAFVNELLEQSSDVIETFERAPRQVVDVNDSDPVAGPADAPITMVLFSDFQCPYCQRLEPILATLQERFRGQLRLVWKDFPLPIHRDARAASEAARCAGEQGAFWSYRDRLFENQSDLGELQFRTLAATIGLDERRFADCLASNRFDAFIEATIAEGRRLGVNSTPTMFINGAAVTGAVPLSRLESLLREELRSLDAHGGR